MARSFPSATRWLHTAPAAPANPAVPTALASLPRRCRQAFLLSRLDECSYTQIATQLGIPLERVEQDLITVLEATRGNLGSPIATQWYVRLQSPSMTASARIDFRRWLDADARHLHAFHQTELHWRSLSGPAHAMAAGAHDLQRMRRASFRHCLAGLLAVLVLGLLTLQ
ncbi:sigma factor-like helix-turn-helix DNA-binding protein [Pseudomonas typographi]|uniref:sigma factor-like helix-turn-helix DNA-binding protein n=1 Tax=Pseudomonas typographi TaxID=2715964 RepID=UPI001EED3B33|nr:sigma-70 region 4 domain-containing protein [Pseudomonas typographi]